MQYILTEKEMSTLIKKKHLEEQKLATSLAKHMILKMTINKECKRQCFTCPIGGGQGTANLFLDNVNHDPDLVDVICDYQFKYQDFPK